MDYDAWAEWYDIVHAIAGEDEVRFYVAEALRLGGPVLEIGVGTGRVAIPMAGAGLQVTGVDLYQPMLDRARARLAAASPLPGGLELVQADMRDLALGRVFPLVLIPGRTLLLLTSARDQRRSLRRAAAHLAPSGRLILNVFNPTQDLLADSSPEPFLVGEASEPASGLRYRLMALNRFDTARQTNRGVQIVEERDRRGKVLRRAELAVRVRYLYPTELMEMLRAAGLAVTDAYGSFDGSPLTERSDEIVFIAEKAV